MFEHLVEITEPVCREIDPKKADYLMYDTTGIERNVNANKRPRLFGGSRQSPQPAFVSGERFASESITTTASGRIRCITKRILSFGMATQPPV